MGASITIEGLLHDPPDSTPALADTLRALEAQRTRALVARDIETSRRLHAPEYQLVTPAGKTFDRDGYLGAIADGSLTNDNGPRHGTADPHS